MKSSGPGFNGGKRNFIVFFRKVGFLTLSLLLHWPLWFALYCVSRFFRVFNYLFLVYPGSDTDLDGYCPRWLANSFLFREKPVIGGIISGSRKKKSGRGLVLVIPNKSYEFGIKEKSEKITRRLILIKKALRAKSIAFAGQAPGFMEKVIELPSSFVKGIKGTVFCIAVILEKILKMEPLPPQPRIVIVGVGRIGGALMKYLFNEGFRNVKGIDIKPKGKKIALAENAPEILAKADVVIVLMPKGSGFLPYSQYLKPAAVVLDDTHPQMREKLPQTVYKVAVEMPGARFFPRLPGYRANWMPGCAVEAIVAAKFKNEEVIRWTQHEFNEKAKEIFNPLIIRK